MYYVVIVRGNFIISPCQGNFQNHPLFLFLAFHPLSCNGSHLKLANAASCKQICVHMVESTRIKVKLGIDKREKSAYFNELILKLKDLRIEKNLKSFF